MGSRFRNLYWTLDWKVNDLTNFKKYTEYEVIKPEEYLLLEQYRVGSKLKGDKNYCRPMERMMVQNLRAKQRWYRNATKVHFLTIGEKYDKEAANDTTAKNDVYQELFNLSFANTGAPGQSATQTSAFSASSPMDNLGMRKFSTFNHRLQADQGSIFSRIKKFVGGEEKQTETPEKIEPVPIQPTSQPPPAAVPSPTITSTIPDPSSTVPPPQKTTAKQDAGFFENLGKKALEKMASEDTQKLQQSFEAGKFDLDDFGIQMKYTTKAGSFLKYVPGASKVLDNIKQVSESPETKKSLDIIAAMTPQERSKPAILIDGELKVKAKNRIAKASGVDISEVNKLLYKYQAVKITYDRMFQLRKQGKPIPNSTEELMEMIEATGGLSKKEKEILRRAPQ
ncbi:signal recognition particle protein [Planoprotostelium fungivorum]|uniref:Signal recognition particle protein n=1 Tax=Planoprotostelium fungivorum TaxID=1890364 RepID=A0A2P6NDG5_9EUKA|nr:signal recognition particle protein [Planoprotostelium fungivorum]PRP86182.1 signal recognition particle protein [Planoprotostelium fungivorum]